MRERERERVRKQRDSEKPRAVYMCVKDDGVFFRGHSRVPKSKTLLRPVSCGVCMWRRGWTPYMKRHNYTNDTGGLHPPWRAHARPGGGVGVGGVWREPEGVKYLE